MDIDNLVEKVRKLLALAESPNEHEAALAAERAQDLMLKHGIGMAQVAAAEGKTTISVDEARMEDAQFEPWRRELLSAIVESMGAHWISQAKHGTRRQTVYVFAPAGTAEAVVSLYQYLEGTLVTLSAVATAMRRERWINGKTWRLSFLAGAVYRIGQRLDERRAALEQNADTGTALVLLRDAVKERAEERFPDAVPDRSKRAIEQIAFLAGMNEGDNVSLGDRQVDGRRLELAGAIRDQRDGGS